MGITHLQWPKRTFADTWRGIN